MEWLNLLSIFLVILHPLLCAICSTTILLHLKHAHLYQLFYFLLFSNFGFLTPQVFLSAFRLRVFVFSHIFALSQRTGWMETWLRALILFQILLIQIFNYLMNFLQSLYCLLVMIRLVTWVSFLHHLGYELLRVLYLQTSHYIQFRVM